HQDVGLTYGKATSPMGGDGIVFYVEGDSALVCSMNDLKYDRVPSNVANATWERNFTWSVFGSDTVMERDTIWCKINRSFRHFVSKEVFDSVFPDNHTEPFLRYNFEERDSTEVTIYPMLRYKAYTEKGVQVCPPFTKDTAYNGFIGELIPADSVLRRIDTTWAVLFDSINKVIDVVIEIPYKDKVKKDTIWRNDTVNRRDTILDIDSVFHVMPARYSDTIWNNIKKGDRNYESINNWKYALDTNWSYSLIPDLGENDPNGKVNTWKILTADVPCRQKVEPDSSSAARTCYTYYTNRYYPNRDLYKGDTLYKGGQGQWYLPSRDELKKLFDAREKINEMNADTKGFEPLENCYWSSNQRDAKNAWYQCFSDNGVDSYIPKANNNYRVGVRAVRKVKWPK
ncbi:MAG: DUF1566 domain-containing protein, partial [Bacteroidales bacterium]|nr:DUF1566 domain-containing protein [Bacteroidales bacterium]